MELKHIFFAYLEGRYDERSRRHYDLLRDTYRVGKLFADFQLYYKEVYRQDVHQQDLGFLFEEYHQTFKVRSR